MPRVSIKERSFQEPIHEDAPGFSVNKGHKNLIDELNQEVLPSYATDIIGNQTASPDLYQFRINGAGKLEFYANGAWNVVQGAGGGSNMGNYMPTYKALVQVEMAFASDCFVFFDIETTKSISGRDFRVFQFGIERATTVYSLGPGAQSGSVKYRVTAEATLQSGINDIEVRYGAAEAEMNYQKQWELLNSYDVMEGAFSYADNYAIVRPRNLPDYIPRMRSWTEFMTVGTSILQNYNTNNSGAWSFPQQYWNANKAAWVTPRLNGLFLDLYGDQQPSYATPVAFNIDTRTCSYNSTSMYQFISSIRVTQHSMGNLYFWREGYTMWGTHEVDAAYVYGLLNNGWWLFGEYKHHTSTYGGSTITIPVSYGMRNGQFHLWPPAQGARENWDMVSSKFSGAPELRMFVPLIKGTAATKDEPIV